MINSPFISRIVEPASMSQAEIACDQWHANHLGIKSNGELYWLPVSNPALTKYAPSKLPPDQICRSTRVSAIHIRNRDESINQCKCEVRSAEHNDYRGIGHNNSAQTRVVCASQSWVWRLRKWA